MTGEKEKCRQGRLYDANNDAELIAERQACKLLCHEYNHLLPSETKRRNDIIIKLFGKTGRGFLIEQPFFCDYGYNIELGENFYSNHNLVILDPAKVTFGDNVFIGPAEIAFTLIVSGPKLSARYLTLHSNAAFATPITL